ncbi:MAG: hypothetical protein JXB85_15990 [Anaerolineales bacterium]|nr:hypothetical protein [Anaerolineales bacterium]
MKSHWIEHKGRRIFFADYSDFENDTQALQEEVDQAVDAIAQEAYKSVLVLSSFVGTLETISNLRVVRQAIPRANQAVIKRALLGVSGPRRLFITTFASVLGDTIVKAFDTQIQALDWLVE